MVGKIFAVFPYGDTLCHERIVNLLRPERSEGLHFFNAALDRGYAQFGFLVLKYISKWAEWTQIWQSWSLRVYAGFAEPILLSATRGPRLLSDQNAKMAPRALESKK